MGPRRWCRGRPRQLRSARSDVSELQWGHDEGVVEGAQRWRGDRHDLHGFNGATTKVSWKARSRRLRCDTGVHASMGPRRWCRGRRWRMPSSIERPSRWLQWGHDEGVVEGGVIRVEIDGRWRRASMGPRRWCRGRRDPWVHRVPRDTTGFNGATTMVSWKAPKSSRYAAVPAIALQWGHDDGVVEGYVNGGYRSEIIDALQWGHDDGVVEGVPDACRLGGKIRASMGPRRRCRGRRSAGASRRAGRRASMGPRRRCRGRRQSCIGRI